MRTAAAPPYLLPPDGAVSAEPWHTIDGVEIGERLEHWDPFTDIELIRVVTVDVDAVREACQLGADPPSRSSRRGGPTAPAWPPTASRSNSDASTGTSSARRDQRAGRIGRRTSRSQHPTRASLSGRDARPRYRPARPARSCGPIVDRVVLEGGAARFPISPADFTSLTHGCPTPDSGRSTGMPTSSRHPCSAASDCS